MGWITSVVITMTLVTFGILGAGTAVADDPEGTCIELHCYCQGPDQPDTVAACSTTCDAVCGGTSTSSSSSAATPTAYLAKWSLTSLVGPSYTSHDARGGTSTPAGGALGAELDGHFGRRGFGLLVRLALTSRPFGGPGVGLAPGRALVFDWFDVGLELSPRLAGGPRWDLRPTAAVWVASTALLACDGCADVVSAGGFSDAYGDTGWGARAGFDLYLGSRRRRGISLALVYLQSQVGSIGDGLSGSPTEHVAPRFTVQLGLTAMPDGS